MLYTFRRIERPSAASIPTKRIVAGRSAGRAYEFSAAQVAWSDDLNTMRIKEKRVGAETIKFRIIDGALLERPIMYKASFLQLALQSRRRREGCRC